MLAIKKQQNKVFENLFLIFYRRVYIFWLCEILFIFTGCNNSKEINNCNLIGFNREYNYKIALEVVDQLINQSNEIEDQELYNVLSRVKIKIPYNSNYGDLNAYVFSGEDNINWIVIEEKGIENLLIFAELGVLCILKNHDYDLFEYTLDKYDRFCEDLLEDYSNNEGMFDVTCENMFYLDNYDDRNSPQSAPIFILFDQLTNDVFLTSFCWTILHEIAHHVLGHLTDSIPSDHQSQQEELEADNWAFKRMIKLNYSLADIYGYLSARKSIDDCLNISVSSNYNQGISHPSWDRRATMLKDSFNINYCPDNGWRIFSFPMYIPYPILTTINIPSESSEDYIANISQWVTNHETKQSRGLTEWNENNVHIFTRALPGTPAQFIISDATQKMPIIDLVYFDINSNQYITKKLPAIQANLAAFNVFEREGRPIGILSARIKKDQIVIIHLNKVNATKQEINDILKIISKLQQDEKNLFTSYIYSQIDKYYFELEIQNKRTNAKKDVEKILGSSRCKSFFKSYTDEYKKYYDPINIYEFGVGEMFENAN